MKTRAFSSALSRCRTILRRWLRFTWLSRLPLLGPLPWYGTVRPPRRRSGGPPKILRPRLEVLEGRWTPDDILSAASSPLRIGSLMLLAGNHITPMRLLLNSAPPAVDAPPPQPDTSASPYRYTTEDESLSDGNLGDLAFVATIGQTTPDDGPNFVHNAPNLDESAEETAINVGDANGATDPIAAIARASQPPATTSPPSPPAATDSPAKYAGAGGGGGGGGPSTPNAGMGGGGPTGGGSANLHLPGLTSLQRFLPGANTAIAAPNPAANMPAVVTQAAAPNNPAPGNSSTYQPAAPARDASTPTSPIFRTLARAAKVFASEWRYCILRCGQAFSLDGRLRGRFP
jgi:hypothetical protein